MTSYRTTDKLVCSSCRRVYDKDPFGSLLPYFDDPEDECRCGGVIEDGYDCAICGATVPESEAVIDGEKICCTGCRSECEYCYTVIPSVIACLSEEGYTCCPNCKRAESEAA